MPGGHAPPLGRRYARARVERSRVACAGVYAVPARAGWGRVHVGAALQGFGRAQRQRVSGAEDAGSVGVCLPGAKSAIPKINTDGVASTDVSRHRGRRLQGQEEDRDPFLGSWRKATSRPSAPQRRWLQDGFYSGERDLRPAHAQMHAHTHTHTHTRPCAYARARTLAAHYTSGGPPCCVSCMTVFFLDYSLMNSGIGTVTTYTSCIRME